MKGDVKLAIVVIALIALALAGLVAGASALRAEPGVSVSSELAVSGGRGTWTVEVTSRGQVEGVYAYLSGPSGFKVVSLVYYNSSASACQPYGVPLNSTATTLTSPGAYAVELSAYGIAGVEPGVTYSYTVLVVLGNGRTVQVFGTLVATGKATR